MCIVQAKGCMLFLFFWSGWSGLNDEYCKLVGHLPMLISNRCWQLHRWDGPAPTIVIHQSFSTSKLVFGDHLWMSLIDHGWILILSMHRWLHMHYALMSYYPGSGAPRPNVGTLLLLWSSCGWPWNCQKSPWTCHTMTTLAKTSYDLVRMWRIHSKYSEQPNAFSYWVSSRFLNPKCWRWSFCEPQPIMTGTAERNISRPMGFLWPMVDASSYQPLLARFWSNMLGPCLGQWKSIQQYPASFLHRKGWCFWILVRLLFLRFLQLLY